MSELQAERTKAFFASRSVWWNIGGMVAGQLAFWLFPNLKNSVCGNQELALTIGLLLFTAFCAVNLWLRKTTHCRIGSALVLALLVSGCGTTSQVLEKNVFYKRDIVIGVNGNEYEGVVTVPHSKSYQFTIQPKGDIDLMLIRTCHRTFSVEKVTSGWFGKNKFSYLYSPISDLEDSRTCPLRLDAYESSKEGRHSWAFVDFESPKYKIQSELTCDGQVRRVNGIGVCQAKKDTVQRLKFQEPVRFAPPLPNSCNKPIQRGDVYEFLVSTGECLYHHDTQDGRLGRLTVVGYEGVLIRSPQ